MSELPDLFGAWRLRRYYLTNVQTRERIDPFGAQPNGVLILLPEGRMVALLTPEEQKQPATEAEEADAFRRMIAYSGLYQLEPPDRFVTTVDAAWFHPWVGSNQARRFKLNDNTLDNISDPTRIPLTGDALVFGTLSWVRETAAT